MNGLQYVVDSKGKKTAVIINLNTHPEVLTAINSLFEKEKARPSRKKKSKSKNVSEADRLMRLSQKSFDDWNNDVDDIYNDL